MKILHIGCCATGRPYNGLQRAFIRRSEYRELHSGLGNLNKMVLEEANDFLPDMVFMQLQSPNIIDVETVKKLRSMGCFVINWTGDARVPLPQWYIDIGRHASLTLFSNETDVNTMHKMSIPADYLQIGFDECIYSPKGEVSEHKDIVFMGNNYNDMFSLGNLRIQMVSALRKEFPDQFGVFGRGWSLSEGDYNHSQEKEASVYRGCKIAINLSHYDLDRYSSDRILRIMGSGAFCLSKYFPGYNKDYIDGEHLRIWHTIPELIQLIRYYLHPENTSSRIAIAQRGMKLTHQRDTFQHMVDNMINIYRKYSGR